MRSFVLACVSIVVIGVGAHYATGELDRPVTNSTDNPAVRLD